MRACRWRLRRRVKRRQQQPTALRQQQGQGLRARQRRQTAQQMGPQRRRRPIPWSFCDRRVWWVRCGWPHARWRSMACGGLHSSSARPAGQTEAYRVFVQWVGRPCMCEHSLYGRLARSVLQRSPWDCILSSTNAELPVVHSLPSSCCFNSSQVTAELCCTTVSSGAGHVRVCKQQGPHSVRKRRMKLHTGRAGGADGADGRCVCVCVCWLGRVHCISTKFTRA